MNIFIDDIELVESTLVQRKIAFLREREWQEHSCNVRRGLMWSKQFDGHNATCSMFDTDSAISAEKTFANKTAYRNPTILEPCDDSEF